MPSPEKRQKSCNRPTTRRSLSETPHSRAGLYRLHKPAQRASTGLRTPLPLRFRTCISLPAHGGVRGEGVGTRVAFRKHDGGGEMPRWTGRLRQADRAAGWSLVRRTVTGRSHEGSSFRCSAEAAFSGGYSYSSATVKQRGNDENGSSVVLSLSSCSRLVMESGTVLPLYRAARRGSFLRGPFFVGLPSG